MNGPAKQLHSDDIKLPDPVVLSQAMARAYERAQPLIQNYIEKHRDFGNEILDPFNLREATIAFWDAWLADPQKAVEMQTQLWTDWLTLWQQSALKFLGEESEAVIEPQKGDRRFRAKEWQDSAIFDFIKQSYLLTADWMQKTVQNTEGLPPKTRDKLNFHVRQFVDALSPSNFVMTNPEVLHETLKTGGDNLIRGLENLIEDLERGQGELKISTTDYDAFTLGENIAVTDGAVIYENDLMQLIQYAPSTKTVHETPLLIIPPWINKYYILDLRPENSFIRWAVAQGHTVFVVSWVNPDKKLAKKRFEDYMEQGIIAALDKIETTTKQKQTNIIGYCLGGTLLTITLAYLKAKKKDKRVKSATFLTTLLDFQHAGDLTLFIDDDQLALMDREMAENGVLQAKSLQRTFSMLRANDLIWSFVINNYLMGREPFPFDLLYWNDDSTNMPAAMHSFYLRKLYRDNLLTKAGGIKMHKTPIDIRTIDTPAYFLSTREDHIAPWIATYAGTQYFSGPVTFTLAASGHIAGVVNPPTKNKYCYWTNKNLPPSPNTWMDEAKQYDGSWWPQWQKWITPFAGKKVPARKIGKSLEPAPGRYVSVKSN